MPSDGESELGFDVSELLVGLLDAAPGDRPEVGGVVGDEGQLDRSSGSQLQSPGPAGNRRSAPRTRQTRRGAAQYARSVTALNITLAEYAACKFRSSPRRSGTERHHARRRSGEDVRPMSCLSLVLVDDARDRGRRIGTPDHRDCPAAAASGDPRRHIARHPGPGHARAQRGDRFPSIPAHTARSSHAIRTSTRQAGGGHRPPSPAAGGGMSRPVDARRSGGPWAPAPDTGLRARPSSPCLPCRHTVEELIARHLFRQMAQRHARTPRVESSRDIRRHGHVFGKDPQTHERACADGAIVGAADRVTFARIESPQVMSSGRRTGACSSAGWHRSASNACSSPNTHVIWSITPHGAPATRFSAD